LHHDNSTRGGKFEGGEQECMKLSHKVSTQLMKECIPQKKNEGVHETIYMYKDIKDLHGKNMKNILTAIRAFTLIMCYDTLQNNNNSKD
jgi:hypothetical protein